MDAMEEGGVLLNPEITTEMWDDIFTSSSEDEQQRISETVQLSITQAHRDPLEECMDGVEAFVHSVLKTGKVTVAGEAGDLSKLHAVLFGLQATEKEIPQLLLQLLRHPFFNPNNPSPSDIVGDLDGSAPDYLGDGHLQVGVHIDTLIYNLLHSHCTSQARQAEQLIEASLSFTPSSSSSSSSSSGSELGPPLIFASLMRRPPPPPTFLSLQQTLKSNTSSSSMGSERAASERSQSQSSYVSISSQDDGSFPPDPLSPISEATTTAQEWEGQMANEAAAKPFYCPSTSSPSSSSSTSGIVTENTAGTPFGVQPVANAADPAPSPPQSTPTNPTIVLKHPAIRKLSDGKRTRKTSVVAMKGPSTKSSKSSDSEFSGDEHDNRSRTSSRHGSDTWHMYSPDPKDLVIAAHGDNAYPLLMWDPTLKVEFKLSSSLGILSGSVVAIEPSKPTVTIKVKNTTAMEVGFSVRAYRQTAVQKVHVVYPAQGLHKMDPYGHWEDNADFMSSENQEFFVLELFVCTQMGTPAWNVMRKYAVMKAVKSNENTLAVSKPRKFTHFQFPGTKDTKEQNLKTVIAQGLQCVIKDKLAPAEIIFTQAQLLPDFQRLPLLAFVHICLAVIANKKSKERNSLQPMIAQSNYVAKLLDICDSSPAHIKMPKMIMLVKQLRKELNLKKVLQETKKRDKRLPIQRSSNDTIDVDSSGGKLTSEGMTLDVPPGALPQETKVTLTSTDIRQLQSVLLAKGWDQTITILASLEIHCTPLLEEFGHPVRITTPLPSQYTSLLVGVAPPPQLCLLHSKFMRHWQDITSEEASSITVVRGDDDEDGRESRIHITTDRVGFLAVTKVNLDPFKIAQIAMRSLVAEPVVMQVCVCAELFTDDNAAQVVIFIQPCKPHGEPLDPSPIKPQDHTPVSFPHMIQAYAGERLRLSLVGHFEAHDGYGETDLNFGCDVSGTINQMYGKWVKLQAGKPLTGKLMVSSCKTPGGAYETLAEINISSRTCARGSTSSSS